MGFERKYPLPEAAEDQSKLTFKQGQLELYYDLEEQLRNKKGEYVSPTESRSTSRASRSMNLLPVDAVCR